MWLLYRQADLSVKNDMFFNVCGAAVLYNLAVGGTSGMTYAPVLFGVGQKLPKVRLSLQAKSALFSF